jgi:hydrogenase nickel incorporation protein HypA/HybF
MHELSIATSLVDLACDEVAGLRDVSVYAIHVQIGVLSGVVRDALEFSFEAAATGMAIAGARLVIHDGAATIWCSSCQAEQTLGNIRARCCPVCQTPAPHLLSGAELQLLSLEVRDDVHTDR